MKGGVIGGNMDHERLWTLRNKLCVLEGKSGWMREPVVVIMGHILQVSLGVIYKQ